jgi:hypothetical protein
MAATTSSLLEGLTGAIALSTAALEDGADFKLRRAAMRSLHRSLNRTAESDELWTDLTARAAGIRDAPSLAPDLGSVDALLDSVADVFVERYAVLLAAGGYKSPPPPRVNELLTATRQALVSSPAGQPVDRVTNARDGIRNFVQVVAANIDSQNSWYQRRVLQGGRRVAAASLLLPLIWSTEIKTGNEFDVNFGVSWKDKAAIEITIPRPWAQADAAAEHIVWGGVEQLQQEMQDARAELERGELSEFGDDSRTERAPSSEREALRQRISDLRASIQRLAEEQEERPRWTALPDTRSEGHSHGM